MSPPRSDQAGLYELMQAMRAELIGRLDKHGEQLGALSARMDTRDERVQALKDRVLIIEKEREAEEEDRQKARRADRRISAVISSAAAVIFQIGKEAWNFYHPSAG